MAMVMGFVVFTVIISGIIGLIELQGIGGLDKPEAEVGVAFSGETTVLRLRTTGVIFGPPKPGEIGDSGLTIAVFARAEAFEFAVVFVASNEAASILDFAQDTGDQNGAETKVIEGGLSFWELI